MVIPKLSSVALKHIFVNYFFKKLKILESSYIDDYMKGNRLLHWKQIYFLLCLFQSCAWCCLCSRSILGPLQLTQYL